MICEQDDNAALLLEAGYLYRYAGRYREAGEIFQGVQALRPTAEAPLLALAALRTEEGNTEEALACSRRALAVSRSCAAAFVQLAEIHLLRREFAEARENLGRAGSLKPSGPTADFAAALAGFLALVQPGNMRLQASRAKAQAV